VRPCVCTLPNLPRRCPRSARQLFGDKLRSPHLASRAVAGDLQAAASSAIARAAEDSIATTELSVVWVRPARIVEVRIPVSDVRSVIGVGVGVAISVPIVGRRECSADDCAAEESCSNAHPGSCGHGSASYRNVCAALICGMPSFAITPPEMAAIPGSRYATMDVAMSPHVDRRQSTVHVCARGQTTRPVPIGSQRAREQRLYGDRSYSIASTNRVRAATVRALVPGRRLAGVTAPARDRRVDHGGACLL
jgi:hypothetical protein